MKVKTKTEKSLHKQQEYDVYAVDNGGSNFLRVTVIGVEGHWRIGD
ncbi:hypothetical protein [Rummeliibacillus suwonensis]|nr:hypothetical protein [Rummeliibacillus suwonensis]MBO2535228.1 hypothetical protein [Rummeliibacillus suwonensis]